MSNAIITYLNSKYVDNFIRDFILTLFDDGKFDGNLYVISYGLTDREEKMICSLHNNIFIHKGTINKAIEVQRNYDIITLLNNIEEDNIMTIDAGDVWFQEDFSEIFDLCRNKIGVVAENEKCDEMWMGQVIQNIKDKEMKDIIYNNLKGKNLIGSGMICADRKLLINFLSEVIAVSDEINEDFFGVDQIAVDFACYTKYLDKLLLLPHTYDFVILERLNPYKVDFNKKIIDKKTNKLVKIVHNAGGINRQFPNGRRDIINNKPDVLCAIPTKNRYFSTLIPTLLSIANQTVKPDKIVIIDDSDNIIDLRTNALYRHVFGLFESKGIKWEVLFGKKLGQHHSHELANMNAVDLVWRVDDDVSVEPDVLEKLLEHFSDPKIGAVGGLILTPPLKVGSPNATGKIENSLWELNPQMFITPNRDIIEVDHLHCSFLYRSKIAHYDLNLTKVAHREETLFSYAIKETGYKVLVDKRVITWHLRNPEGGIRSTSDYSLWARDDQYYHNLLLSKGIKIDSTKIVYLSGGLGDAVVFKKIFNDFINTYKDNKILIVTPYYDLFSEYRSDNIKIISHDEGHVLVNNIESLNIYSFMLNNNWKDSLEKAYRTLYKF